METITQKNSIKEKLIAAFQDSKENLFGKPELREQAIQSFEKLGIPGRRHEEYRYLNMELTLKGEFSLSPSTDISDQHAQQQRIMENAIVIVVKNGIYSETASDATALPKGLTICSIAEAAKKHFMLFDLHFASRSDMETDPFTAMNTALAKDGVFIHVEKNTVIEKAVHIIHIGSATEDTILNTRNLVIAEENAQLQLIESYNISSSPAKLFSTAVTEIFIGAAANVDHYKLQDEGEAGYSVNTTQAVQKKNSVFSTHTFILSGSLVRNNLNIILEGEHIESHLNGLYLTRGSQVVDNHTLVDHRMPNCNSNELYKGIIDERSSATFNGKIYVRKDAQKTNAFQSNKNILLSDDGTINTKPQLEIYADDVKCSHGTSTGKLDEDKIFYLRARGLSEASAKKMLMHAFASEVVETVRIEALRDYVEEKISKRFE